MAKLDKIKFAVLVAFIVEEARNGFDDEAIAKLDGMIDIELPEQPVTKASMTEVDELLRCMMTATDAGFIPAIKAYRVLTGAGLRESKDAIERYRFIRNTEPATLGDILGKAIKY